MSDRFLEDLKDRTDLVSLVGRYSPMKKVGAKFRCRSPFRTERTPSFYVDPQKGLWYDFGESTGGDAIRFLERVENLSFREAVEALADISNVNIPADWTGGAKRDHEEEARLFALHDAAQAYFVTQLQSAPQVQEYLRNRGLTDEMIADWGLGFAGSDPSGLSRYLSAQGFKPREMEVSGVSFAQNFGDKTARDRFVGRVMLPVKEPRNGKIIAFTGRLLPGADGKAKYINSPENPVYVKSKTLFGFDRARHAIDEEHAAVLVEGNFDVITAHGAGLSTVIATCGTSLTDDHIRLLRRRTKKIVLAFDTDLAGKKATLRGVELCLREGMNPFVADLSKAEGGHKDLDDLAQKAPDVLKTLLQQAPPALEFLCEAFAARHLNGTTDGEKAYLDALFPYVRLSQRPLEIDAILDRVAQKLRRAKGIIQAEYDAFEVRTPQPKDRFVPDTVIPKQSPEEKLAGFLSLHWDDVQDMVTEEMFALCFTDDDVRGILLRKHKQAQKQGDEVQLTAWDMHQEKLEREPARAALNQWVERRTAELKRKEAVQKALAQIQASENTPSDI